MAEDDIYGNKKRYETFKINLEQFAIEPKKRKTKNRRGNQNAKYYCKNRKNLEYFKRLFVHFEAKDLSFIRRMRMLHSMQLTSHICEKDMQQCDRNDINGIMAIMHNTYTSPKTKETFIKDLKHIWKMLFPEIDEKERPDETIVPYPVRHLSARIDKSRQKLRGDKITWEEFEQLVNFFNGDARMQLYLNLALECLARPQELLYLKIRDVELHDNYAKIWISEHGKEGTGLLQCIDSYPYLLKWLKLHPMRNNQESYLFINTGNTNTLKQLRPENVNKMIRLACNRLKINKPITCYSLKRNGVTIRRLRGETDMEIQHAARWASTQQLKTYDMSNQEDALKRELQKRGLLTGENIKPIENKRCTFCNTIAGFNEKTCPNCYHLLDRTAIVKEATKKDEEIEQLQKKMDELRKFVMSNLTEKILQTMESS